MAILPAFGNQGIGKLAMLLAEKEFPQVICWQLDTILQEENLLQFYTTLNASLNYQQLETIVRLQPKMDLVFFEKKMKTN